MDELFALDSQPMAVLENTGLSVVVPSHLNTISTCLTGAVQPSSWQHTEWFAGTALNGFRIFVN